jgi:hypothetical protein
VCKRELTTLEAVVVGNLKEQTELKSSLNVCEQTKQELSLQMTSQAISSEQVQ